MTEEAEEVLKESDPVGSPDLNVVQTRIEKLKVLRMVHIRRFVFNVLFNIVFLCVACPLTYIILFQGHLLKLSSLSPDLERVNEMVYRIPVSDRDIKRLQSLNRAWATHSAHLTERFRYQKSPFGCLRKRLQCKPLPNQTTRCGGSFFIQYNFSGKPLTWLSSSLSY